MTIDQVITLTQAGFTRDEILAMTAQPQPAPQVQTQPAPQVQPQPAPQVQTQTAPQVQTQPAPQAQPQPAPQVQTQAAPQQNVEMSQSQFNQLLQQLNLGQASIDVPPKYNLDNTLQDHFSELLFGKKKED